MWAWIDRFSSCRLFISTFTLSIAAIASSLSHAQLAAPADGATWLATSQWKVGDKVSYQVQQSVKERTDGKEETRFLSNGTLDIEVLAANDQYVELTWHRRMDNGELELVREPWGIRGNPRMEHLVSSAVREGFPIRLKFDAKNRTVFVVNSKEVAEALAKRIVSPGGEFGQRGGQYARRRPATPDELQQGRTPTNAQLGIHQPLVKYDSRSYVESPRWGYAVGAWYTNISLPEIRDFLGWQGLEFTPDSVNAPSANISRKWKATGTDEILISILRQDVAPSAPPAEPPKDEDSVPTAPKELGLAGGVARPLLLDAKLEIALPSGWPKRAAIVRAEDPNGNSRTTLRRVYLRQTP